MPVSTRQKQTSRGLRDIQVNPLAVGAAALVLVAVLVYAFWIRPSMQAASIAKEWASPEAAAARSPEGRPKDAGHEALVQQLQQKEGRRAVIHQRRRDEQ